MDNTAVANKNVLVVEDNIVNQHLVKHTLSGFLTTVTIAENGQKAIELIKTNSYDFVLMDIFLPDINGYETASIIRNELNLEMPIIAMTASILTEEKNKCLAAGMNGCLCKPFTVYELNKVLQTIPSLVPEINKTLYIIGDEEITIDLNFLYTIADTDTEYVTFMINTFLENMPAVIEKMQQNCMDKDWDKLTKTAHYAKSSLSVVQIKQMTESIIQIENKSKLNESFEDLQSDIFQFLFLFNKSKNILNNYKP